MIITIKRYDRDDPYYLLIAMYGSGLYKRSTQSFDLIDLLESASSCEDLLLGRSESFF